MEFIHIRRIMRLAFLFGSHGACSGLRVEMERRIYTSGALKNDLQQGTLLSVSHTQTSPPRHLAARPTFLGLPTLPLVPKRGGISSSVNRPRKPFHAKSRPGLWSSILYLSVWLQPRIQPLALTRACLGIFFTSTFFCARRGKDIQPIRALPFDDLSPRSVSSFLTNIIPFLFHRVDSADGRSPPQLFYHPCPVSLSTNKWLRHC